MSSVLHRTVRGGFGYVLATAVQTVSGMALLVVAARRLGPEGVGLLVLGMAVAGFVRNAAEWGLPITAQRYLSGRERSDGAQVMGMLAWLGLVTATVAAVTLFVFAEALSTRVFGEPGLTVVIRILTLSVALTTWVRIARSALQARERIRHVLILDTATHGGRLLLFALVLWRMPTPEAAAWALALSLIPALVVGVSLARRAGIRLDVRPNPPLALMLLRHATPVSLAAFSYMMAKHADKFMLGALASAGAVGVYGVAASVVEAMRVLPGAFATAFMPLASDAYREGRMEDIRVSYRFINRWVSLLNALALIGIAGFGPWLLRLFGHGFGTPEAFTILLLLSASLYTTSWLGPTGALLQMANGQRIEFVNTLVYIGGNIALNLLLIPSFGAVGAAAATAVSALVRNALQAVEIRSMYGFSVVGRAHVAIFVVVAIAVSAILLAEPAAVRYGLTVIGLGSIGLYSARTFPRDQLEVLRARLARRGRGAAAGPDAGRGSAGSPSIESAPMGQ